MFNQLTISSSNEINLIYRYIFHFATIKLHYRRAVYIIVVVQNKIIIRGEQYKGQETES